MPDVTLAELDAHSLGPIAEARIEFGPGFNVLTGETGVGKTLLIGALTLCLGEADVRGVSEVGTLRTSIIFVTPDGETAFGREVSSSGRLRATLDGVTTSASALREAARELIVIHGQHDSLRLRQRSEVVRVIDAYGGIDDSPLRKVRATLQQLQAERAELGGDPSARQREKEFLEYQIMEIDSVAPKGPDELETTLATLRDLATVRDHADDVDAAVAQFDGEEGSILDQWSAAAARLPHAGRPGEIAQRLAEIAAESRELIHELRSEAERQVSDPEEMTRMEVRVGELQALARKYGGRLESVLVEREQMAKSLAALDDAEARLAELDFQVEAEQSTVVSLEQELLLRRRSTADAFVKAVQGHFPRVALGSALLRVSVDGADGSQAELLFASDPNQAPGPLHALASGGELARVLLAMSLETVSDSAVAVFDEVDAGIGGSVAQQIGDCLYELSKRQQVIAVTHLASVAAKADHHFVIDRDTTRSGFVTTVREVTGDERVREISRMLAGETEMKESRDLAIRLLHGGPPDVTGPGYNESP